MKWLLLVLTLLGTLTGGVLLLQRAIIFPIRAVPLPGLGASAEHPGPLVVFSHGNGELIDYWVADMAPFPQGMAGPGAPDQVEQLEQLEQLEQSGSRPVLGRLLQRGTRPHPRAQPAYPAPLPSSSPRPGCFLPTGFERS
jgi:hypothetical protein